MPWLSMSALSAITDGAGFGPLAFVVLKPGGVAPGWYGSGALPLVVQETSVGRGREYGYGW